MHLDYTCNILQELEYEGRRKPLVDLQALNPFTADPVKALHFVVLDEPTMFYF